MTSDQKKQLVRAYYEEVVGRADAERVEEFVAPDYVEVYQDEVHPIGLEGAKAHVLGAWRAFPDLRIEVGRQIAEGEYVVTCMTVQGTHRGDWLGIRASNRVLTFSTVNVDRVVDGRIVEHGGAANLFEGLLAVGSIRIVDPAEGDHSREHS